MLRDRQDLLTDPYFLSYLLFLPIPLDHCCLAAEF